MICGEIWGLPERRRGNETRMFTRFFGTTVAVPMLRFGLYSYISLVVSSSRVLLRNLFAEYKNGSTQHGMLYGYRDHWRLHSAFYDGGSWRGTRPFSMASNPR